MTVIIGINAFHADSSACILRDGELVAAVEEERFRREKHWAGFPSEAIKYCLCEANIPLSRVDYVAINQDRKANLGRKLNYVVANRPDMRMIIDRLRNKRRRLGVQRFIEEAFPNEVFNAQVISVEHHMAHLSSAFHVSPFQEAVVVSVDGFGDFASAAWGVGQGIKIKVDQRVYFPHSLGIFYQALTQFLGFPHYGDEYKVMGLAPYGKPAYMKELREIVLLEAEGGYTLNLDYFRHHKGKVDYQWENGIPIVGDLYGPGLIDVFGEPRKPEEPLTQKHKDIASSVQLMYEEAFFHLLNSLYKKYNLEAVAVSGGCGMNSVANGKIKHSTPFKKVYVQSAAGDAGGAIGAAYSVWHEMGGDRALHHDHAYWGPQFNNNEISGVLETYNAEIVAQGCDLDCIKSEVELCRVTASAISDGCVVGWFQGRMEWGPRALGNRSIVCDPRRSDMKDILNLKIKRRESFRPFAPSILREAVSEWFTIDGDVPFMMQVFPIKEEKRQKIPAVTHVDGTGRLQTVYEHTNPRYYMLIKTFETITGVPMVLNTSFNENEPVVCTPEEALLCFLRTKMDVLVMGNYLVRRNANESNISG